MLLWIPAGGGVCISLAARVVSSETWARESEIKPVKRNVIGIKSRTRPVRIRGRRGGPSASLQERGYVAKSISNIVLTNPFQGLRRRVASRLLHSGGVFNLHSGS